MGTKKTAGFYRTTFLSLFHLSGFTAIPLISDRASHLHSPDLLQVFIFKCWSRLIFKRLFLMVFFSFFFLRTYLPRKKYTKSQLVCGGYSSVSSFRVLERRIIPCAYPVHAGSFFFPPVCFSPRTHDVNYVGDYYVEFICQAFFFFLLSRPNTFPTV